MPARREFLTVTAGAGTGLLLPHAAERLDAQYAGVLINERCYPQPVGRNRFIAPLGG